LFPELGFSYAWNRREAFSTDNLSNPDVHHGEMDESEFHLNAGIKAFGQFELPGEWVLSPYAGLGITQTLTDGVSTNTMSVGGLSKSVSHQNDTTLVTPKAGIKLRGNGMELGLGYNGAYSRDTEHYLFWLQLGVEL
ncbi:MAG: autotransporter outer membrane beta-barrel domain-containing protein, partial [Desulfobacterales bacterium]|nr:autotransporter outer membrane beta-barrel domain-containing protein [Desulfobacterales bacterium]